MPYVNLPNDLSKIKTKMAFNLTKRQLVCFGSAGAVGTVSYTHLDVYKRQIYDRLIEMCSPVCFTAKNFRKEAAKAKLDRLKELLK